MRRALMALAGALAVAAPHGAASQSTAPRGILFRFGGDAYRRLNPGDDFTLPLMVDASLLTNNTVNVASLSGVTYWPSCLAVTSISSGSLGAVDFGAIDGISGGYRQELSIRSTTGVKDGSIVAVYRFHALEECNGGAAAFGRVLFHATVLGSNNGAGMLDRVAAGQSVLWPYGVAMHASSAYCIGWQGTIGQVRGLPITALDAEQVARFTVSLPVFSDARVTLYGDVNDDGEANIIDAQQLARYVAGLSAASDINQSGVNQCDAQLASDTASDIQMWPSQVGLQAGNALAINAQLMASRIGFAQDYPATGSDAISWSTGNSQVATVTNKGVVRAVGEGTAYITGQITRGARVITGAVLVTVVNPPATTQPASVNLSIAGASTGSGSVTSDVGELACSISSGAASGACSGGMRPRSIVTLAANPAGNSRFVSWSGDCSGIQPECVLEMATAHSVTASFAPLTSQNRVTVVMEGAGDGSVAADAVGISCASNAGAESGSCSANVAVSSSVSLTATAGGGSSFAGWSGDCAGTGACVVAMSQARSVTATFARDAASGPQLTIAIRSAVAPLADAYGSVATTIGQDISGQTCNTSVNASCAYTEPTGSLVTLKATPGMNYSAGVNHAFMEWRGACSGTAPTCSLQMNTDRTVEAVFRQTVSLGILPSASGTFGRVDVDRSSFQDTSCTTSCALADLYPATYTVTPVPATGWRFRCWMIVYGSACEDYSASIQRSPTTSQTVSPRFFMPITPTAIAAGRFGACAVRSSGALYCWGRQYYNNTTYNNSLPTNLGSPEALTQISVSMSHGCGVAASKNAYCWGLNSSAQLGDSTQTAHASLVPTLVKFDKGFTRITAGSDFSCGLVGTGYAYCWGSNSVGQVSLGASCGSVCTGPTKVSDTYKFIDIAAGSSHTCGVTTTNAMVCWGENSYGALGVPTSTCSGGCAPQVVSGGNTFTAVSAGDGFTCGLTTSGGVLCWGLNSSGQLGTGTTNGIANPTPTAIISPAGPFDLVTASGISACARVASGRVGYCWGGAGQVNGFSATPTAIASSVPTALLTAGTFYACFKKPSNGDLVCFGENSEHQIGTGLFFSGYVAEPWVMEHQDP